MNNLAGMKPLDPKAYRILASRRQLRAWVKSLEYALKGRDDRVDTKGSPAEPRGLLNLAASAPKAKKAAEDLQAELVNIVKVLEEEMEGLDTKEYEAKLQGLAQVASAKFDAAPAAASAPMKPAEAGLPGEPDPVEAAVAAPAAPAPAPLPGE